MPNAPNPTVDFSDGGTPVAGVATLFAPRPRSLTVGLNALSPYTMPTGNDIYVNATIFCYLLLLNTLSKPPAYHQVADVTSSLTGP